MLFTVMPRNCDTLKILHWCNPSVNVSIQTTMCLRVEQINILVCLVVVKLEVTVAWGMIIHNVVKFCLSDLSSPAL